MVALFAALLLKLIRNRCGQIIWKIMNRGDGLQAGPRRMPDQQVSEEYNNKGITYISWRTCELLFYISIYLLIR